MAQVDIISETVFFFPII